MSNKRNPAWTRDELILALDLYMRHNPAHISKTHPDVIALSKVLNNLPIHSERPDETRFRNPNGVYMKLCNFLRFDPDYSGKGLVAGGKLEEGIWNQFHKNRELLHNIALAIKKTASSKEIVSTQIEDEEESGAQEGKVLFRLHRVRERNPNLVKKKKERALIESGKLRCDVCLFDFELQYGDLGRGFIECHHTLPLSRLQPNQKTGLSDLALVCSNCHRMLHRANIYLPVSALKKMVVRTY